MSSLYVFGFATPDFIVLAGYLILMLLIGFAFSRQQESSKDFFLAGQSLGWFPIGLSVMATLLSALSFSGVPGEGYFQGMKYILLPLATWATVPVMMYIILPLYRGLGLVSVYAYLELRFDLSVRLVSCLAFVVWRLLWLGGVLYAPCKVLIVAAGIDINEWVLLSVLGLISTIYTYWGGMKAVIWTDVIQAIVMVAGVILIILGAANAVDGGFAGIWKQAEEFGRTEAFDFTFDWSAQWSFWGMLPHMFLSMLSFYVADQIAAQRFLTAKDVLEAKRSFLLNCLSVTIMIPALAITGMSLFAFYQSQPQAMRPIWVLNIKDVEADVHTDSSDNPLLDWQKDGPNLDHANLSRDYLETLIADGRLRWPNTGEPIQPDEIDQILNESGQLQLSQLVLKGRRVKDGETTHRKAELIVNKKAKDEFLPRFITDHLPAGIAGLIIAALFAASMSSMDSGLNSISTLFISDFYRRLGWGKGLASRIFRKPIEELGDKEELRIARGLVLGIGVLATLFSFFVGQWGNIFDIMINVVNTFGGPLLSVFILGMFTTRTTAASALVALISGILFTLWIMIIIKFNPNEWPLGTVPQGLWTIIFSVGFTMVVGYIGGFVIGKPKTKGELRGLTIGHGTLGLVEPEEASIAIDIPEPPESRWREEE